MFGAGHHGVGSTGELGQFLHHRLLAPEDPAPEQRGRLVYPEPDVQEGEVVEPLLDRPPVRAVLEVEVVQNIADRVAEGGWTLDNLSKLNKHSYLALLRCSEASILTESPSPGRKMSLLLSFHGDV